MKEHVPVDWHASWIIIDVSFLDQFPRSLPEMSCALEGMCLGVVASFPPASTRKMSFSSLRHGITTNNSVIFTHGPYHLELLRGTATWACRVGVGVAAEQCETPHNTHTSCHAKQLLPHNNKCSNSGKQQVHSSPRVPAMPDLFIPIKRSVKVTRSLIGSWVEIQSPPCAMP